MIMDIDMDLLCDFSINLPRVIVSGNYVVIDNVSKIISFTDKGVVADTGTRFTVVNGEDLKIKNLLEDRVILSGKISSVEFYTSKKGD